jgi:hypothetical protein
VSHKHKDAKNKKLISYDLQNGQMVAVPSSGSGTTTSADTKKENKRAASEEEAKAKARADLAKANRERTTGSWSLMGQPNLVSGNVVALVAAGKMSGNYLIMSAQHRITRSGGYTVELSLCRVSASSISLSVDMSNPDLALSTYGYQQDGAIA